MAAHTLYEKTNPRILTGPGGHLDLTGCAFTQKTDRIVRVSGSRFVPGGYTIKLEGAKKVGYRTISIAGVRDPIMIAGIEEIKRGVRERVADNLGGERDYYLGFKIYGRDGVMDPLEPSPGTSGVHELGIVIEAVAQTQERADTICSLARSTMLHYGYEGRRATAGNFAFPYSPSDFHVGEVYVFSVYQLLSVDDPVKMFPAEYVWFYIGVLQIKVKP